MREGASPCYLPDDSVDFVVVVLDHAGSAIQVVVIDRVGGGRAIEFGEVSIVTIERGEPGRLRLGELDLRIQHIQLHPRAHAEPGTRQPERFAGLVDVLALAEIKLPILLQIGVGLLHLQFNLPDSVVVGDPRFAQKRVLLLDPARPSPSRQKSASSRSGRKTSLY